MNLIQRATSAVARINHKLISKLLSVGVPRYGKRMIFVVSLFVGFKRDTAVNLGDLEALNERLHLASCTEALEFPSYFSKRIWGECDLVTGKCPTDIQELSTGIVKTMPSWMRYSTYENMVEDVKGVLRTLREQPQAA